jgi:glycosyltransferase involved in cell wall biosynthesis
MAPRIRAIRQEHTGCYAARNLALRHATGDLVAFVDADDCWRPDRLSRQLPLLDRPEVGLVFGDAAVVTGGPGNLRQAGATCFGITPPARGRVAPHFIWGNFVPTSTVLVRRTCLDEIGGFSVAEPVSADYLAWFRIAVRHELDFVAAPVADYAIHDGGISRDLERSLRARLRLFSAELARTTDPATRDLLRRLILHLSLHLSGAAMRGRTAAPWDALRCAGRSARAAGVDAPAWTAAFAYHHLRRRAARRGPASAARP